MESDTKVLIDMRLRVIEARVRKIQRMIETDRNCLEVLAQTGSVVDAVRRICRLVQEDRLRACIGSVLPERDPVRRGEKVEVILTSISKFRGCE